jgi:ribosomal protein S18 acetylase RimI-like enzyme
MLTFTSGKYIDLVTETNKDDLLQFCLTHTDADHPYIEHVFKRDLLPEKNNQLILGYKDNILVSFLSWKCVGDAPYIDNNPDLRDAIIATGYNPEVLYVPTVLIVHNNYRRQGIASEMSNYAENMAKEAGMQGRILFLYASESLKSLSQTYSLPRAIDVNFTDLHGTSVKIVPL